MVECNSEMFQRGIPNRMSKKLLGNRSQYPFRLIGCGTQGFIYQGKNKRWPMALLFNGKLVADTEIGFTPLMNRIVC